MTWLGSGAGAAAPRSGEAGDGINEGKVVMSTGKRVKISRNTTQ